MHVGPLKQKNGQAMLVFLQLTGQRTTHTMIADMEAESLVQLIFEQKRFPSNYSRPAHI